MTTNGNQGKQVVDIEFNADGWLLYNKVFDWTKLQNQAYFVLALYLKRES